MHNAHASFRVIDRSLCAVCRMCPSSEIMEKKGKAKEHKRTTSLHAGTRTRKMPLTPPPPPQPAKAAFDPSRCSVTEGYWAYNRSKELLYTDQTCPFIDRQVSCQRNGRPDSDYLRWDWHLDDCSLPRSATGRVLSFPSFEGMRWLIHPHIILPLFLWNFIFSSKF